MQLTVKLSNQVLNAWLKMKGKNKIRQGLRINLLDSELKYN